MAGYGLFIVLHLAKLKECNDIFWVLYDDIRWN